MMSGGVETTSLPRERGTLSQVVGYSAILLYAVLAIFTAYRHEPWADEAQSWLLARDASLAQLWTRLLHYEGTPGLWHTLLHILIRLGFPYSGINFIAVAGGVAAAWLLIHYSPLPVLVRIGLPFTYYLFFQYGVIARSYSLLPVFTFGCAILSLQAARRPWLFTAFVCMLAAVSLGGFVLACLFYCDFLFRTWRAWPSCQKIARRRIAGAAAAFAVAATLIAWSAWPANDNQFFTHLNLSTAHLLTVSLAMIQYAFTGEWVTTIAVIALSLPFLLRAERLPLFVAATFCLCLIHSVIYTHVWHFGALLLAWLFCMWTAAARVPLTFSAAGSLALVIGFQGYWTIQSARYDWHHAYSGSFEAAEYLKQHPDIGHNGVFLVGFSTSAVKPYFSAADLGRMTHETGPEYWDWSARGEGNDPSPLFKSDTDFKYLMAGYKLASERARWAKIAGTAGFERMRHFEGNLFWRTSILETESFDLYRRVRAPDVEHMSSSINPADLSAANQLITGFYNLESNAWSWTAARFSVALRRPAGADRHGGRLTLDLFIPDAQIRDLGPMTLRAAINGHELGAEQFRRPGDVIYTRDVRPEELDSALTIVTFSFDKARAPSSFDDRELGAIVKTVLIEKK